MWLQQQTEILKIMGSSPRTTGSTGNDPSEKKRNISPMTASVYCLDRVSRLQHREGEPKQGLAASSVEEE